MNSNSNEKVQSDGRFAPPRTHTIAGVLGGGGAFVGLMLSLALVTVLMGGIEFRTDGRIDLGPWLILELIGGVAASLLGGIVSRRLGGHYRATAILAGIVLCVGLVEAATVLANADRTLVLPSRWLVIVAPFVATLGVLFGGLRRRDVANLKDVDHKETRLSLFARIAVPVSVLFAATAVAVLAVPLIDDALRSRVVASAVTLDFTLALPAIVYVAFVRTRRLPWISLVPVFVIGYAFASATLPSERHDVLDLLRYAVIPVELVVVGYLVVLARRTYRRSTSTEGDFATRFRMAARRVLQSRIPADILTTEIAILYYAFRQKTRTTVDENSFSVYRDVAYFPVLLGLCVVLVFETIGVHFLVRQWSHPAAWVLTGLSIYALIWLIGDYRAMKARPIEITQTDLRLRVGLRWESDIPIDRIAHVDTVSALADVRGDRALKASLIGQPNINVRLDRPVEVIGMYGIRKVTDSIWLTVDNSSLFVRRLNQICAENSVTQ